MSSFVIEHRAALSGKTPLSSAAVSLRPMTEGHVLHLMAASTEGIHADSIGALSGKGSGSVRAVSPDQWFLVGDEPLSSVALAELAHKLKPVADVVDQGHGRVRIAIHGAKAATVLAKGTAVDLSLSAFPVDYATTTLFGHISAHITRISDDGFELIVLRGFAESLWDELAHACAEYR